MLVAAQDVACAKPANWVRKIAPKNQNHEMPSSDRKTTRLRVREAQVVPGLGERIPVDRELGRDRAA